MSLVLTRGDTFSFKASFFEDDLVTPLVPIGPEYPSFSVFDINNTIVSSGTAVQDGLAGNYAVSFSVAPNAALSQGNSSWRIEWTMVTDSARQVSKKISFDVQDATKQQVEAVKDQSFLSLKDKPYRAMFISPVEPVLLSLEIFNVLDDQTPVATVGAVGDFDVTTTPDGSFVYTKDIPGTVFDKEGMYLLNFSVSDTATSPIDFVIQRLFIIQLKIYAIIPSVRMFIDRLQKSQSIVYAYTDADIFEYLKQGMNILNNFFPRTCYNITTLPGSLGTYWLYATAWHALQAQFILDGELAFNSSGQTTSLEVDHTGAYSEAIGRMMDYMNENISKTKLEIRRQSTPVATVAGRQYSVRGYQNYVFNLRKTNSIDFPELLAGLGLL